MQREVRQRLHDAAERDLRHKRVARAAAVLRHPWRTWRRREVRRCRAARDEHIAGRRAEGDAGWNIFRGPDVAVLALQSKRRVRSAG